jgi:sulfoxide reductase heme-binding subunit YedZ
MNADLFLWLLARVAGLTSFAALAIAVVSGIAIRSALLDRLGSNRAIKATHEFTSILWIPLGVLHVIALLFDATARIRPIDIVVPFVNSYDGTAMLAVGLGTLSFDLVTAVVLTAWLRARMNQLAWYWAHRLAYAAFAVLFLHAVLAGTDFSDPYVSAITWATAFVVGVFALARVLWGRLPAA